jgi:hypothetical protein
MEMYDDFLIFLLYLYLCYATSKQTTHTWVNVKLKVQCHQCKSYTT